MGPSQGETVRVHRTETHPSNRGPPFSRTGENVNNATLATMLSLVLIGLSIAPAAVAAPGGGPGSGPSPCYQWYKEVDLGPVEIVSTSSCSYSVQESDDGEGPL